jgi:hypothetical protein
MSQYHRTSRELVTPTTTRYNNEYGGYFGNQLWSSRFSNPTGVQAVDIVASKNHKTGIVIRSPTFPSNDAFTSILYAHTYSSFVMSEVLRVVTERCCLLECDSRQFCIYLQKRTVSDSIIKRSSHFSSVLQLRLAKISPQQETIHHMLHQ